MKKKEMMEVQFNTERPKEKFHIPEGSYKPPKIEVHIENMYQTDLVEVSRKIYELRKENPYAEVLFVIKC